MIKNLILATGMALATTTITNNQNYTLYWKTYDWQDNINYYIRAHELEENNNSSYSLWSLMLEYDDIAVIHEEPTIYDTTKKLILLTRLETKAMEIHYNLERFSQFYAQNNIFGYYKRYVVNYQTPEFSTLENVYQNFDKTDDIQELERYVNDIQDSTIYWTAEETDNSINGYQKILNYDIETYDWNYGQNQSIRYILEIADVSIDEYTTYPEAWQSLPNNDFTNTPYSTTCNITIEVEVDSGGTGEVIDLPGLLFDILGMPFAFISQAFNLTLFPGTNYAIHVGNLIFTIIGALLLWIIIKKVILK